MDIRLDEVTFGRDHYEEEEGNKEKEEEEEIDWGEINLLKDTITIEEPSYEIKKYDIK